MRIPLTKYGWPQVVIYPGTTVIVMVIAALGMGPAGRFCRMPVWAGILIEVVLAILLILSIMFFRDPHRASPQDGRLLLAPADGKITDIETVYENDFIGGSALKIGIFLSIFDAHINRAPCNVKVETITYKKGKYTNAANPRSANVNESNDLALVRTDSPKDRLVVRQISGAIARRIVCRASRGQKLVAGEKFGMIKFGSRTELYAPKTDSMKCLVQVGDKVKAGLTPLLRYEQCEE